MIVAMLLVLPTAEGTTGATQEISVTLSISICNGEKSARWRIGSKSRYIFQTLFLFSSQRFSVHRSLQTFFSPEYPSRHMGPTSLSSWLSYLFSVVHVTFSMGRLGGESALKIP